MCFDYNIFFLNILSIYYTQNEGRYHTYLKNFFIYKMKFIIVISLYVISLSILFFIVYYKGASNIKKTFLIIILKSIIYPNYTCYFSRQLSLSFLFFCNKKNLGEHVANCTKTLISSFDENLSSNTSVRGSKQMQIQR